MNMSVGRTTLSAQTPRSGVIPSQSADWRGNPSPSPPSARVVSRPLAVTEGLSKGIFRAPARGTFALGGKSTQKRRSNLRFENPLRAFTQHLSRWCSPRERCAVEISPKCCIVSASLSAAAFAPKCRVVRFYIWCVGAGFYAVERSGTSALGVPRPLFHHRAPLRTSTNGKNTFQPAAKGRHLPLPLRGKGAI